MPTFGENLRRIRKQRGLKSKDIALKLGIARSVVSGWENNRRGLPETPTLLRLAKATDATVEELLDGVDVEYVAMIDRRRKAEAVVGAYGIEAEEDPADVSGYTREDIPVIQEGDASPVGLIWDADAKSLREVEDFTSRPAGYRERGAYAIVLHGDSMEPLLKRGMRLIVSPNIPVANGDLAYVQLRSHERLIKIATKTADGWLLTSANPAYGPRSVKHDEIEHIHRVAYVRLLK